MVMAVVIEAKMTASSPDVVGVGSSSKVNLHGNNGKERRNRARDLGKGYERGAW